MKRVLVRLTAALAALLLVVGVLSLGGRARAEAQSLPTKPAASLDDANRAFAEGHYPEAVADFSALVATSGPSAPLLFDLGNAYLRDDQPVRAILSYERARLLDPHDPALATNLAVARTAASVTDDAEPLDRLAHTLATDAWTTLAVAGLWGALAAAGVAVLTRRRRRLVIVAGTIAAVTCLASSAVLAVAARDLHAGLVMQPAPVLVSPFATAQSDFALAPGTPIELDAARDGYVLVKDRRGRSGWVERSAVEPLIPPVDSVNGHGAG